MKFHNPLPILFFLLSCAASQAQDGNPRHPGVAHFPEIGSMSGALIYSLPDINNDSIPDFCIVRSGRVWIYQGKRGSLPAESGGLPLGPTETQSATRFLAAGDWDGKNGPDICVQWSLSGDTSFGNTQGIYDGTDWVTVFWNQGDGSYSLEDTTRLYPGIYGSFSPEQGVSGDFNSDGIDDLYLNSFNQSLSEGAIRKIPKGHLFKGYAGNGVMNVPEWQWWNAPRASRLGAEDLDMDGHADLILYNVASGGSRPLAVLYGRADGTLPDTIADLQQIEMSLYGGRAVVFSDVSGDGIPEMNLLNPDIDQVKIFIGCKGQRLLEQFGSGNDPAHPGEKVWWGKPWAAVKGPNLVSNAWFGFGLQLLDLGSADSDTIEEIWVPSSEFLLCYNVGGQVIDGIRYGLDSVFDGEILTDAAAGVRLGDIDRSGRATFALSHDGTLRFYQTVDQLPIPQETYWRVPQGKDTLSEVQSEKAEGQKNLSVHVEPNPSSGEVRIFWQGDGKGKDAAVRVSDMAGHEVLTMKVPANRGEAVWNASGTFGGTYFITVTVGDQSGTTKVVIK